MVVVLEWTIWYVSCQSCVSDDHCVANQSQTHAHTYTHTHTYTLTLSLTHLLCLSLSFSLSLSLSLSLSRRPLLLYTQYIRKSQVTLDILVLDMVRLAELAKRRGEAGLMPHLACFFKAPLGVEEHRLSEQFQMLQDYVHRAKGDRKRLQRVV